MVDFIRKKYYTRNGDKKMEAIMKGKKQSGFLMIELLVIFTIISVVISIFFIRERKIQEIRDLEESVVKISSIIDKYTFRSFETSVLYKINLDYKNKKIKVQKVSGSNDKFEEIIFLPDKLTYLVPYTINGKERLIDQLEVRTTINGNLSDSFTTYVLDYSQKSKYRIASYSFQENKILKINVYKKILGDEISIENLLEYHNLLFSVEDLQNEWRKF